METPAWHFAKGIGTSKLGSRQFGIRIERPEPPSRHFRLGIEVPELQGRRFPMGISVPDQPACHAGIRHEVPDLAGCRDAWAGEVLDLRPSHIGIRCFVSRAPSYRAGVRREHRELPTRSMGILSSVPEALFRFPPFAPVSSATLERCPPWRLLYYSFIPCHSATSPAPNFLGTESPGALPRMPQTSR